jgi:hypothetical protein
MTLSVPLQWEFFGPQLARGWTRVSLQWWQKRELFMLQAIHIRWEITSPRHDTWDWTRVLYAYSTTRGRILYIGKSDAPTSSVGSRWQDHDNDWLSDFLRETQGHASHVVRVGHIVLPERLSERLLLDLESALIFYLDPPGNIKVPTPKRVGAVICNAGDWPADRFMFVGDDYVHGHNTKRGLLKSIRSEYG